jgi:RES domain-containing protein
MTPLPAALGGSGVTGWRLDQSIYRATWDSGEGAFRQGGRWNSRGRRTLYSSLDPATAILEVAVHKTFPVLDTVPHILTSFDVHDPASIHVVLPADVPNPNWLHPGLPSAGQQQFGDALLNKHLFVVIPSAVSTHSWNLIFDSTRAATHYTLTMQETFALDTRLHPPIP